MLICCIKSEGLIVSRSVYGGPEVSLPPRRAMQGLDDGVDELVQADGPRVPVEVGVKVLGQSLQQLVAEDVEVLLGDLPLGALGLQIGHDDVKGGLVVRGGDDDRQTVEDALGEGLELGRVDIVPAILLDEGASLGVRLENVAVQVVGELETLGSLTEGLDPLTPDLDPLEDSALGRDVVIVVMFGVVSLDERDGDEQKGGDNQQLHLSAPCT